VIRRLVTATAILSCALACSDAPSAPSPVGSTVSAAKSPSPVTRYKLRFVSGVNQLGDGEIQSDWFPDTGIVLNTRSPWKSIVAPSTSIDLLNSTHGHWNAGTCATFRSSAPINVTSWDLAGTSPVLSFSGRWQGTLAITQMTGTSVSFDGDRVVGGSVTPDAGGIHNVVTNGNQGYETKDPSGKDDWFQLEIRDAALKFGSASTPDGVSNPAGVEVACASFTIRATKSTLVEVTGIP